MIESLPKLPLRCAGLFLIIASACAGQDTPNARGTTRDSLVTDVSLTVAANGETQIAISVIGPSKYHLVRLSNPRRLVLDFQDAKISTGRRVFPAHSPLLRRVRGGQFRVGNPAVARVVADLIGDPLYEVREQPGVVQISLSPKAVQAQSQVASSLAPTRVVLGYPGQSTPLPPASRKNSPPTRTAEKASPPPSPLQALGYTEMAGGNRQAYIAEGDQLYMVREGESFAGRYKLLKLTPNLVEIENQDLHTAIQLSFNPSAAGGSNPSAPALEALAERLGHLEKRLESLEKQVGTFLASHTSLSTLPLPNNTSGRSDELLRKFGYSNQAAPNLVISEGGEISLTRADGSEPVRVTRIQGMPAWPRWTVDGRLAGLILPEPVLDSADFQDLSTSTASLYSFVADEQGTPTEPDYSLSFSERVGLTKDWVIHDTAGAIEKAGVHPAQLPGGRTTTFGFFPTNDGSRSLVLVKLPQGELARYDPSSQAVLPYLKGTSAEGMDFSKDGGWLTYVSFPDGTLWRERVDGKERLQLTFPSQRASSPRWSPDGTQIAFSATTSGTPWSLFVVSKDGGPPQRLTNGEHNEGDASWSPDGSALMFSSIYGLGGAATAIYVLDLRSNRTSQLPHSEGMYGPRWSFDGRFVVASTVGSRRLEIYDFETRIWSEIASLPATWKVWSKDGKYIYFDVGSLSDPAIYRLRISDHQLERIANLKGFRRLPTFGSWFTLAPDDSLIIARDTDSQEIYALDW